jgi:hypothetical protein
MQSRIHLVGAILLAGIATAPFAVAQQDRSKNPIVGTWSYVAVDVVAKDGGRTPMYGPNPSGLAIFDATGHYMLLTAQRGQAKFAANNRLEGTPEENASVVHGSIAHFGTYTVDEAAKTITFNIETSTFPNWNGTTQKRPYALTSDELRWSTPGSSGGTAEVVLRRVR